MNKDNRTQDYKELLATYKDPYLKESYVGLDAIQSFNIKNGEAQLSLNLPYPCALAEKRIRKELDVHFAQQGLTVSLHLTQAVPQFNPRPQTAQLSEVRNIIAIASGKGGVGKSTVALNIARALAAHGASVGLLDADIYGPSQPHLLQTRAKPNEVITGKELIPIMVDGLQTMSLSYLLADTQTPTIWRGAMASNALQQLLYSSQWRALDYLVIDLPPGTGDIQLTLCQRVCISGAVIISTPHPLTLLGATKGVEMFRRLYVPVMGILENMSYYVCPRCEEKHHIFGEGGAARLAKKMNIPLLAELPLCADCHLRLAQQDAERREQWQEIALNIAVAISAMKIALPPPIQVIED